MMPTLTEQVHGLAMLMEADPKRDAAYRKEAVAFLKKLRRELHDQGFIDDLMDMAQPKRGGYALPADWIDKRYRGLLIMLVPKTMQPSSNAPGRVVAGGFGSMSNWKVIQLPVLKAPMDLGYVSTRIDTGVFVHEFIHYLDNERGGGFLLNPKTKGSKEHLKGGGESSYYNDPGEFNAYYQEGARSVEAVVRSAMDMRRSSVGRQKVINSMLGGMKSAQSFSRAALKRFNQDFVGNLNPKYRKKLMARLAGLYSHLKKTYDL